MYNKLVHENAHYLRCTTSSDAGWEYVSRQVSSHQGLSFPVGTDVRSPDLGTPPQCSPVNRSNVVTEMQPDITPNVQDVTWIINMVHHCHQARNQLQIPIQARMDRVNAEANAESLIARGNEMRDAQLRDLLAMRGMFGRSSSSSSTMRPLKNIFKKDDGDKTEKLIAELMERDVKAFDESKRHESSTPQAKPLARPAASSLGDTERLAKIEAGYVEQMTELRAALRQAKQTEEHLRDDRNHWRQAAEYFQQDSQQDNGDEQEGGRRRRRFSF